MSDEKKTEEFALWAGRNARETMIDDRLYFRRGFPRAITAEDKKLLEKNPDFVFISADQATEKLRELKAAKTRPEQNKIAEDYVATMAERLKDQKTAHLARRDAKREENADKTKAARKKAALVPHTIVIPGEKELPKDAVDLGPTPAPPEEKDETPTPPTGGKAPVPKGKPPSKGGVA